MTEQGKCFLRTGILLVCLFAAWTVLIRTVDVRGIGPMETEVGFSSLNAWFHELTGVHMKVYILTDWLGLVPVLICLMFGVMGFWQLVGRRNLKKVDADLVLLGIYYLLVIAGYLVFEMIPVNYRPILMEGRLEASYPSSTTLLVLSVMPSFVFQTRLRMKNVKVKNAIHILTVLFSAIMIIGRLISGVHWFTDIAGAVLLSRGLFCMYRAFVVSYCMKEK